MKIRIHRRIELVHIPYITAEITQSKFLQTGLLENYRSARRHVLEYSQSLPLTFKKVVLKLTKLSRIVGYGGRRNKKVAKKKKYVTLECTKISISL